MSDYSLTITKADNGFILTHYEEVGEGKTIKIDYIIEEKNDAEGIGYCEATQKLLYDVLNYFSLGGSKHDKKRVRIIIEEQ